METLHTIATNLETIWYAPKDWSVNGGLSWLTFYLEVCVVGFIAHCLKEVKDDRQARNFALYRAAEEAGRERLSMMDKNGFIEHRSF